MYESDDDDDDDDAANLNPAVIRIRFNNSTSLHLQYGNAQTLQPILNTPAAIQLLWWHCWLCFPLVGLPLLPQFSKFYSGPNPTDAIPRWTSHTVSLTYAELLYTSKSEAKHPRTFSETNPTKDPDNKDQRGIDTPKSPF